MAEEGAVLPGAQAPESFFGRGGELQRLRREARSLLRGRRDVLEADGASPPAEPAAASPEPALAGAR